MPAKIDFHDCVHHGIAGPTPDHILATIRAEYWLPPRAPAARAQAARAGEIAVQAEDFAALARALGGAAFRQLLSDCRRGGHELDALPAFLAQHRYGRATPALVDLARLEHALAVSERAPQLRSVGACCLPPEVLRSHPDLVLTFHPAWRWLALETPADQWREALLGRHGAAAPPPARATRLRIAPDRTRTVMQRPAPALFAFERTLQAGESLQRAAEAARRHADLEPIQSLQPLLTAGAVIDVALHPARDTRPHESTHHEQPTEAMP